MRRLAMLSLMLAAAVQADVYRWTDKNGVVHYADKPLVPEAKPADLPNLQTYQAGSPPPLIDLAATPPARGLINISSPASGASIDDADGCLTIEVATEMADGQGVVYYLDGAAQNKTPTPSTALLISSLKPGAHTVTAALVDTSGHELARAAPVKISVKPAPH